MERPAPGPSGSGADNTRQQQAASLEHKANSSLAQAARDFARDMADVAERLFPQGRNRALSTRTSWRYGKRGSLAIDIGKGVWHDHETGEGGGVLALIERETGLRGRAAVEWIGSDIQHRPAPRQNFFTSRSFGDASDVGRKRAALKLWREAKPIDGTPAERYLRDIRRVALPPAGADAIRYHPRVWHGHDGHHWPAMIALMTDPATGAPCGIHRTYLDPDDCMKAEVEPQKMMLGNAGVVRLCADEDVTIGLGIAEGIETSLAVIRRGWTPLWAALSAGAIARFPILPGFEALTIFADADATGQTAGRKCGWRWRDAGRQVRMVSPRTWGKDWADA